MRNIPSYDPASLEAKWQARWDERHTNEPDLDRAARPFYNLMMFPYPSAEGLHVGNMFAFTGADIYGRFKRLQGYDVFEPMGFDAFGIHSENYALATGTHPAKLIPQNIATFRRQLRQFGGMFDWRHELSTTDPSYYKWTQWIFVQLFKAGLAYKKRAAVNWCPKDKTVLANEQVIDGRCERCGTAVEQRFLEQWFFRITDFAERLLANLDPIDWSSSTKLLQRNWIGRSEGAELLFETPSGKKITVFTTRPDTVFGATYLVLTAISCVALMIGGIGVMNIMLVSVTERTKEIGLRKAVGATRTNILSQFLIEAVVLTAIGGLIGLSIGELFSFLTNRYSPLPAYVPPWAIGVGIGISAGVGIIFGLWPAWKAARLDPIESLRWE